MMVLFTIRLNKIGNQEKQKLKAMLWSFLMDSKNGNPWTKKETRQLLGIIGCAKYIEPKFVTDYVTKYERKSGMNFRNEIKKFCVSRTIVLATKMV